MINLLTVSDIPTVDPDFDDLELLYSNPEADCVGDFGEEIPLANPREQALHDYWEQWDERHQDKLDHAKPSVSFNSAFDELMDRWEEEMEP